MRRVGIVGGTGFPSLGALADAVTVETPYGDVELLHERLEGTDLFWLRRHGREGIPAHRIDHRANVEALARARVDGVLALNSVGALAPGLPAPSLLVPDDLLDLRKTTATFHDAQAVHVDMSEPYCPGLRRALLGAARAQGLAARDGGTYACVEGPRLETPAEVRMLRALGGTVVGMTGCPEAALARERGLCYASLCLVTNAATGVAAGGVHAQDVKAAAEALAPDALRVILAAARDAPHDRACACRSALERARL